LDFDFKEIRQKVESLKFVTQLVTATVFKLGVGTLLRVVKCPK
jgi:hypothetical protein